MISHEDTILRKAISVQKCVAVTLWCLVTCFVYRKFVHLFSLAQSTVCVIIHDTCKAWWIHWWLLFSIIPPALNHTDYYNQKRWHLFNLQAVVDHDYLF